MTTSTIAMGPAALPALAAPSAGASHDDGGDDFARCLDAAAEEPAAPAADHAPRDKASPRTRRDSAATRQTAPPTKAPVAVVGDAVPSAAATPAAEPLEAAPAAEAVEGDRATPPGPATADAAPPLPTWILAHPAAAAPGEAKAAGNDVAQAVRAAVAEGRPRAPAAHDALAARTEGPSDVAAAAPTDVPRAPNGLPFGLAQASVQNPHDDERPAPPVAGSAPTASLPLPLSSAATPAVRAVDAAPAWHGHVAAPVDSAAFAPALATQVRWLARDGVQSAQLSLNPPEMGPLSVQIVVHDGRHARIDFMADSALTRQAIEHGLPVLAAALDDSGLKLSGGGVHDGRQAPGQQPQPHGAWRGGRPDPRFAAIEPALQAPAGAPHGARGLVDLVA